jgi:Zn-dependent M28 family amino/carboxypeptidase
MRRPVRLLWLLPLVLAALLAAAADPAGARWWRAVSELASDRYEGRAAATEGYRQAAAWLVSEFARLGLKPGAGSSFIQPVPFQARQIQEAASSLTLMRGGLQEVLHLGEDAYFSLGVDPAPSVQAPAVFAGYGLSIPEAGYDDLAGVDLKGKIAVVLRGGPASVPPALRAHAQTSRERLPALRRAGAVGIAYILDPKGMDLPWERYAALRFEPAFTLAAPGFDDAAGLSLALIINPARAEKWFEGSGHTAVEILDLAAEGKPLPRFPLAWTVRAAAGVSRWQTECGNVVAVLPGSDPKLREEYVVISAHLDHQGVSTPVEGDSVYNGAMDNAAGVASLLEIARALKAAPPRRSVLFLAVTAEEKGLLGSRYFAAQPTVPRSAIAANINLDMFLPIHPLKMLTVYGLEESTLGASVRAAAKAAGVKVQTDPEPQRNLFIRSDQYSFIREGIPALSFKFGFEKGSPEEQIQKQWLRQRYHAPSDDAAQPVDLAAAARFNRLMADIVRRVANDPARPRWNSDSFFRRYASAQ